MNRSGGIARTLASQMVNAVPVASHCKWTLRLQSLSYVSCSVVRSGTRLFRLSRYMASSSNSYCSCIRRSLASRVGSDDFLSSLLSFLGKRTDWEKSKAPRVVECFVDCAGGLWISRRFLAFVSSKNKSHWLTRYLSFIILSWSSTNASFEEFCFFKVIINLEST